MVPTGRLKFVRLPPIPRSISVVTAEVLLVNRRAEPKAPASLFGTELSNLVAETGLIRLLRWFHDTGLHSRLLSRIRVRAFHGL